MNLRDLHYIVAVAELKSFVKAAEHCCVSQPTLSMQVKKLEAFLGVSIFERNNKHILITPVGEQIISRAKNIIQESEHIKELATHAQDPLSGTLKLGAFPTLASYIFPDLVPKIREALPKITLVLVEEKTNTLIQQLNDGTIDVALLAAPINSEQLQVKHLFNDPFQLAVSIEHPLSKKKTVSPSDIMSEPVLLLDEGHCLRDQALQFCQLNGASEEQNVRATSLETLRQMIRANTGITFFPTIAIQPDNAIAYIPFKAPEPKRSICLVWRKTNPRLALIHRLEMLLPK